MLFSKAKTDFLEYLEIEQNRSQKTIQNYDHYLTRLIDFAGEIKISDIDGEMIRKWRLWLNRLGTKRFLREARRKVWHNTFELHTARLTGPDAYTTRLVQGFV